jgi:hypothetical protein
LVFEFNIQHQAFWGAEISQNIAVAVVACFRAIPVANAALVFYSYARVFCVTDSIFVGVFQTVATAVSKCIILVAFAIAVTIGDARSTAYSALVGAGA